MKTKYDVCDASRVFLWVVLLPQILAFVTVLIFSIYLTKTELENSVFYLICCALVYQVAFLIIFLSYNKRNKIKGFDAICIKTKPNVKNVLLIVLISIIAFSGFVNFIALTERAFFAWGFVEDGLSLPLNTPIWLIANIILSCIIPAIMEETIFRGIIFNGLKRRGFWFACIISSVCFTIIHFSLFSLIYPMVMGVVFCLIVQKTGSIVYSMIAHFCNNLIVTVINYINNVNGTNFGVVNVSTQWGGAIVAIVAILTFIIIFFISKFITPSKTQNKNQEVVIASGEEQKGESIKDSSLELPKENKYLTLSVAVGIIMWILIFILSRV
ncbi:MAG: CPBP family intramembrane metalloprotease [Clostridia bacterium]|nr:CPBP family intramembrane metalloprotease [Clostridia bacterium]